jgi:Tfp pilus assembly protein PilF
VKDDERTQAAGACPPPSRTRTGPDRAVHLVGRASALLNKREYQRALADCNEALSIHPKSAWAYHIRSLVYRAQGYTAEAEQDRRKVYQLDPDFEDK